MGRTSFGVRHDFVDPDSGERYALGIMTMVTMASDSRRPIPVPDWLQTALGSAGPAVGLEP